jgi:GNAT superfamily N-acetyltransferase
VDDDRNIAREITIAELTDQLLPVAVPLVAQHLWPERAVEERAARADANLRSLLAWPLAHLFLAVLDTTAVGFASVHWGFSTRHGQPILRIQDHFTHPRHRRAGVARTLVQHLADWARGQGAQRLELVTGTDNIVARALYDAHGFECLSEKEISMRFLQ